MRIMLIKGSRSKHEYLDISIPTASAPLLTKLKIRKIPEIPNCLSYLYDISMTDVTEILSRIEHGEPAAAQQLLPLVYDELRNLAAARIAQENPGQTLQATALVHEAYLRLVDVDQPQHWDSRGHFFAAAAEAMRRILVENARRKKRAKRGGPLRRTELSDVPVVAPEIHEDLVALDEALDRLKTVDAQAVQLVHLRYFAGFTVAESAKFMGISSRTADRVWAFARAWLHQEIAGGREEFEEK